MRRVSIVGMPVSAEVAELADAQASGACGGNPVGVQIPPSAPRKLRRDRSFGLGAIFLVPRCIEPARGREREGGYLPRVVRGVTWQRRVLPSEGAKLPKEER